MITFQRQRDSLVNAMLHHKVVDNAKVCYPEGLISAIFIISNSMIGSGYVS